MTLDDGAVVLPGTGYVFWNDEVNAEAPFADQAALAALDLEADTIGTGWENLGHTSTENNCKINKDGSEGDVKGTWQKKALRKMADTNIWSLLVTQLQFTNRSLDLYFGEGDISDPDWYWAQSDGTPVEGSVLVILVDGNVRVPILLPKVASTADAGPEFDPENFTELDVKMTALDAAGSKGLMGFFKAGLGTPAGP